jgi:ribosomal protein S4
MKVQILSSVMKKHMISLTNSKKEIYKIYNPKENKTNLNTRLTTFQKRFNKTKEIRNYYKIATRDIKKSIVNTIIEMETRLDVIIVRMNLVRSINESRQKINHGKVRVNEKEIRSKNYKIEEGDIIEVIGKRGKIKEINEIIMNEGINEVNYKIGKGVYVRKAKLTEISVPYEIVGFYKHIQEHIKTTV